MKLTSFLIAFILFSFGLFPKEKHPLKVSYSQLTFDSNGDAKIQTNLFLDDLKEHMEFLYKIENADFSTLKSNGTIALQRYMDNRLFFEQNGKKINVLITGISLKNDDLALSVEMRTSKKIFISKKLFMTNTLMFDAFKKQTNDLFFQGDYHIFSKSEPKKELN